MDLVEEFLELTRNATSCLAYSFITNRYFHNMRSTQQGSVFSFKAYTSCGQVSVATLLAFLDVLKRRIPSRHLPILVAKVLSWLASTSALQTNHFFAGLPRASWGRTFKGWLLRVALVQLTLANFGNGWTASPGDACYQLHLSFLEALSKHGWSMVSQSMVSPLLLPGAFC